MTHKFRYAILFWPQKCPSQLTNSESTETIDLPVNFFRLNRAKAPSACHRVSWSTQQFFLISLQALTATTGLWIARSLTDQCPAIAVPRASRFSSGSWADRSDPAPDLSTVGTPSHRHWRSKTLLVLIFHPIRPSLRIQAISSTDKSWRSCWQKKNFYKKKIIEKKKQKLRNCRWVGMPAGATLQPLGGAGRSWARPGATHSPTFAVCGAT